MFGKGSSCLCARDPVHYCGQLASTSHTYYLITINECRALRKMEEKEFVRGTLGLEPGTSASESGSLTNRPTNYIGRSVICDSYTQRVEV